MTTSKWFASMLALLGLLAEVGNEIVAVLVLLETSESHLGTCKRKKRKQRRTERVS